MDAFSIGTSAETGAATGMETTGAGVSSSELEEDDSDLEAFSGATTGTTTGAGVSSSELEEDDSEGC